MEYLTPSDTVLSDTLLWRKNIKFHCSGSSKWKFPMVAEKLPQKIRTTIPHCV